MLFERWTGARVFRRWMPKPLFYKNVILIVTEGSIKRRLVKKVWIFLGLSVRENPDKTRLTFSSFSDPLWFASLYWWPLFSLFSGESLYVLLALLFARYSPFYLCLFLFSFFLLSRSAYFGVLSNFLARFSRLTLRLLPLVFFVCVCVFFYHSFSFYTTYFHSKPSLHELELWQFPSADKREEIVWVLSESITDKFLKFSYCLHRSVTALARCLHVLIPIKMLVEMDTGKLTYVYIF